MNLKAKKNDKVFIRWLDHCSFDGKWLTNPETHHICEVESVGYVALNGKNYITIAMNKQTDENTYGVMMTIIKSCITDFKVLK